MAVSIALEERCSMVDLGKLNGFIVDAKAATYVGGGTPGRPCRIGSHDIGYSRDRWHYLDSYFGGTDFAGQEVVWLDDEPVWAMNYFGRIVDATLIDATRAGSVIKAALAHLYAVEGRFLGDCDFEHPFGLYVDQNSGACDHFTGHEAILVDGRKAYELDYRGGLIKR